MSRVLTGLECLLNEPPDWIFGKRLGLLCNPASVDSGFRHARELIDKKFPGQLKAIFFPQHGFFSEKQDNMIESGDIIDPVLGLPVFSLYGKTRIPGEEMLGAIDILIIDLQDVGTRVYTFIYTVSYCLEAAKQFGKKVLILDRPNPINGLTTEGNCLAPACASFVGRYPIPMRHGMTIGEISILFNTHYGIGCDLEVIPMKGWSRDMFFIDTGLPWIAPSPNLPTPVSAMVYPGQVLWEGTNVSEGRGTTQPFELFGAPFIEPEKVLNVLDVGSCTGVILRRAAFEPTSNKWKGTVCHGFQLHVTNARTYRPYLTSLKLLRAVYACHGGAFQWKSPPYEYEYERLPIDLIIGDKTIRRRLERLDEIDDIESSWTKDTESFHQMRRRYCLYPDVATMGSTERG